MATCGSPCLSIACPWTSISSWRPARTARVWVGIELSNYRTEDRRTSLRASYLPSSCEWHDAQRHQWQVRMLLTGDPARRLPAQHVRDPRPGTTQPRRSAPGRAGSQSKPVRYMERARCVHACSFVAVGAASSQGDRHQKSAIDGVRHREGAGHAGVAPGSRLGRRPPHLFEALAVLALAQRARLCPRRHIVERSSWPRHLSLCSRFVGWKPSRVILRGEPAPATTRREAAEAARDQLPWHVWHDALRSEECRAISLLLEEVVDYT